MNRIPSRLAVLVTLLFAGAAHAGGSDFVYALTERGRLLVDGTVLETLAGSFNPKNQISPKGVHRWTDLVVSGSDRHSLRLDGRIEQNGDLFRKLAFKVADYLWLRLLVDGTAVHALRSDGRLSLDGTPVQFARQGFVFLDMVSVGGIVHVLRNDGAVFIPSATDPVLAFSGEKTGGNVDGKGTSGKSHWRRLVQDAVTGRLFSLRGDGLIQSDLPAGGDNQVVAELPVSNALYVDLEFAPDGTWYALRRDGAIFRSDDVVNAFVTLPGSSKKSSRRFIDLAVLGTEFWSLRSDGQVFQGAVVTPLIDLPRKRYVRLAVSAATPDMTDFDNNLPRAAVYRVRAVEGDDLAIPVLATDLDKAANQLVLAVDVSGLPGATFDAPSGTVLWTGAGPPGKYAFQVEVDDLSGEPPVSFEYTVRVTSAHPGPKNKPPRFSSIRPAQALVGVPFVLPILASDRDGDALTFTADLTQGPFLAGAAFDPGTATFSWTPAFADIGPTTATFFVSDGLKQRRLRVKIEVANPLPF